MVQNNAYFFRTLSFGVIFNTVVTEPWCLDYIRKGAIEELLRWRVIGSNGHSSKITLVTLQKKVGRGKQAEELANLCRYHSPKQGYLICHLLVIVLCKIR